MSPVVKPFEPALWSFVTDAGSIPPETIFLMTPEQLARTLEDFLATAQNAVILEDGAVLFDLAQSKYSISGEHNKCLLHVWSSERNVVRRVIEAEVKNETLRLDRATPRPIPA